MRRFFGTLIAQSEVKNETELWSPPLSEPVVRNSNQGETMNLSLYLNSSLNRYLRIFGPMLALAPIGASAQIPVDQIRLGTPTYQGTGCPLGTVSAQLSPDARSLSILFGQFQAEAGGMTGKTVDRKACNVAIPVNVPGGYSVSVI
ncbi:MAG: DUF4360 domain-containing protein, partial [Proteobacteria bacterium]|nr:DUF4360 domain-containing protein [Pseudomonadota bacterium]